MIVLTVSLTACGEKAPAPELLQPIETVNAICVVSRNNLAICQTTGGYVVPKCVDMKFDFSSSVHDVAVVLGDHVKEGDLLFELNSGLENDIRRLELSITREQTEYDYDQEKFNKQIKDMKRAASAMGSSYDGKMMQLQIREMQLNFRQNHAGQETKINEDRKKLEEWKQKLAESMVYAPCSGTIVYCNIANDGDLIDEDKTFITIAKDDELVLACSYVAENDVRQYSSITAQVGGDVYEVKHIPYTDEELFRMEKLGNSFDSYFTADLKDSVKVGDYVLFTFRKSSNEKVLTVPNTAVTKFGKSCSVTILKDGRQITKEVEIGDSDLNNTEIKGGLEEGDVVFVAKDLARYGKTYSTAQAERLELAENTLIAGAKRVAQKQEPVFNEVPGEIAEICTKTLVNVLVKKGDPIMVIKASISRSEQEQAKQDLRKYEVSIEEDTEYYETQIENLESRMKKMKKSELEYSLAELDLKDLKKQYEEYLESSAEQREKLEKRVENYEQWDGQEVTIYAEEDGVISSLSRYKAGDKLGEGDYMFDLYDLNSYCICMDKPGDEYMLRYGQKVTFETVAEGESRVFNGTIVSAPNVRPLDAGDHNKIYVALDNTDDYSRIGETGIIGYTEYVLTNCMLIDELLVGHDEKVAEDDSKKQQQNQQNPGGGAFDWFYEEQETTVEVETKLLDSEEHEKQKGKAYVWVYDDNGCAVKRYVRVMRHLEGQYWIVDGISENDTILYH